MRKKNYVSALTLFIAELRLVEVRLHVYFYELEEHVEKAKLYRSFKLMLPKVFLLFYLMCE